MRDNIILVMKMKKLVAILMAMPFAMTFLPTVKAASPTPFS
ncbi:hypothetical protein [Lysinibacillus sp. SGAir0095]|nr:hypothetical protein [Lysinibacillus sp. SGAir0095]